MDMSLPGSVAILSVRVKKTKVLVTNHEGHVRLLIGYSVPRGLEEITPIVWIARDETRGPQLTL